MRIDLRSILRLPIPTLLLGAINIAIFAGALALALSGTRAAELLATPARLPTPLAVELAKLPPPDLAAIQTQPLMHSTRAFYSPPLPDAVPVAPPLPAYRLAGAFISPNKPAVALLAHPQANATRRVHAGDDVDGWRVESIEAKRVVLRWQEQTREIGAATAPISSGIRRVPIQRQRVASATGSVIPLGAGSSAAPTASAGGYQNDSSETPRLYRPPPN